MEGYSQGIIKRLKQYIRIKMDSFIEACLTLAADIV